MLYGFGESGAIVVAAADSRQEFDDAALIWGRKNIAYSIPLGDDPAYARWKVPPYILHQGVVAPSDLKIVSENTLLEKHQSMMSIDSGDDSIDRIYDMFLKQAERNKKHDVPSVWQLSTGDISWSDDIIFTVYSDPVEGTLALVTTGLDFQRNHLPLYRRFESLARIGQLINIPRSFSEIMPGCFNFSGTPLAARAQLMSVGFLENHEFSNSVRAHIRDNPDASTVEETLFALNMVPPVDVSEFIFNLIPHPQKNSTYAVIIPHSVWTAHQQTPANIFITPLLTDILPMGYAEFSPALFEIVAPIENVRLQLLNAGMREHQAIRGLLDDTVVRAQTLPSLVVSPFAEKIDIETLKSTWVSLSEKERTASLSNRMVSFCVIESLSGPRVMMVPTDHFIESGDMMEFDWGFERRLPGNPTPTGFNSFLFEGEDIIQLTGRLTQEGFQESYEFLLHVNMMLFSSDLPERIGFDPMA